MRINKNDIEVKVERPGAKLRNMMGYGGMIIAYNELPKGFDFTPLLHGLENNSCHCPHWGYIIEGAIRLINDDGSEEISQTGDIFYWPAGHTAIVEEDIKFIEFSPEKELNEVLENVGKRMSELGV